ncbi:MAG: type IX secretion system plug protein domain-containing protein [Melioribacteraceae bacterium]
MNRYIVLILLLITSRTVYSSSDPEIKNLRVYSSGDQLEFPVIDYSDKDKSSISIEFDVQSRFMPNLNIIFKFCDADWNPYSNAFLSNRMYSSETIMWFDELPQRVRGARYHYLGTFPNNNVSFPFSGKWKFFIVDSQNRDKIYASGKFFVVYPEVKLNVRFAREGLRGNLEETAASGRTLSIRTQFTLPDSLFAANIKRIEIVTNRKFSYPAIIDRNTLTADRFYEWDAGSRFSFIARNIRPGNEYRITDLRDIGKYNAPPVYARFGESESSNLFTKGGRDFNGSSYLLDFRDVNADYLNVTFRIRPPEEIKSSLFLVGSFNNWQVLPEYEMFDDNGMMNLSVELKRGVHEYQYVTGNIVNGKVENINWEILEGNFYETENEYNIFLFYNTVEKGGYDKIVGYKKIKTGVL